MSDRSMAAISAAISAWAGRVRRRFARGALALAVLTIVWTGAPVDVPAETLLLKSGEEIEGTIIDATRNTVIVRPSVGGMRQMRVRDIDEVRIDLPRGERISGQFVSWAEGVYQLRTGGEVVRIGEGTVLSREAFAQAPAQPEPMPEKEPSATLAAPATSAAREPARSNDGNASRAAEASVAEEPVAVAAEGETLAVEAPVTGESEAADREGESRSAAVEATVAKEPAAAAAERETSAVEAPVAEESATAEDGEGQTAAVGPPAAEEPAAATEDDESRTAAIDASIAEEPAAARPDREGGMVAVKASVDPAGAGADGMVFRIELSRPAEQTVVLIYGTLDGTAKAGTDYEPQQGVITLAPGTESGEVRVPLLAHQSSEGDRRFELFLIADPKVAEVVDKRVIATIQGDD